jgi:hypothetical protein
LTPPTAPSSTASCSGVSHWHPHSQRK